MKFIIKFKFIKSKSLKTIRNILFIIGLAAVSFLVHKCIEGDSFNITMPEMLTCINTVFIANLMAFNKWK
jgi:hypothetical protein